ncbi:hypothetical protein D3C71_1200830 [compost metagenome]
MPDHGIRIEAGLRVLFFEVLLVALDHAHGLAHQRIEAGPRHAPGPRLNVVHKTVYLGRLELKILEEVRCNLEEGERVELAAGGLGLAGGLRVVGAGRVGQRLGGFVGGLQQFGGRGVADLAELAVGQLEQG